MDDQAAEERGRLLERAGRRGRIRAAAFFGGGLLTAAVSLAGAAPPSAEETLRWLRAYLQIDTSNPPGNEAAAAEYLAGILEGEGIATRLLVSPGGRTSLYARLASGSDAADGLLLVHHLDVVPAGEGWQVGPFSGRPLDGAVWGRGAIDVKSLGIAELAAVVELARLRSPLARDVVYLAVADEEAGGREGTGWLLDAHPELFERIGGVINEGGANRVLGGRVVWWGVEVEQKRPLWLEVTARGRGGHASGLNPESAAHQLIEGLARLVERPLRYHVSEAARSYFRALAELEGDPPGHLYHRLDRVILPDGPTEPLPPGLPVYFVDTVQVTGIDLGPGRNVVAPVATATVDVRLLPDTDGGAFLATLEATLGDDLQVEVNLAAPPVAASPTDHPLYRTLERVLGVRAPVVPAFISGATDSRYFRARGIAAYGVSPFALDPPELAGIHASDERLPIDEFLRGVNALGRVVRSYAAAE